MSYLWFLPMLLGVNFLLFEHKHTKFFRNLLYKTWFTTFLSNCVFCRCLWIGIAIAYLIYHEESILNLLGIGVSSGFLGMFCMVIFSPCLRVFERHH